MRTINSRLPNVGTSIFAVMSKMANEYNAINLSQGFPDFPVSSKLIELVNENMKAGNNQYAPMPGVPILRERIAETINEAYNYKPSWENEITITSGATEALFASISALVEPDDEVIVLDPSYDSYAPVISLNGGKPIHIGLEHPSYNVEWEKVKKAISNKTKAIIINTPHNPTGATLASADLKILESIVLDHGIFVISDEVYERIVFENVAHESILKYPALRDRSIAIYSFGKTFHATGWKMGYAVAPAHITTEIRKIHQFLTFSVNTPTQLALASYMEDKSTYQKLGAFYQQKRDYFVNALKGSRFEVLPCNGTYFQLLSYKKISDKNEMEMAEYLTKKHGVASIPTSAFYKNKTDNKVLRFCFAKSEETLNKAAEILCKI